MASQEITSTPSVNFTSYPDYTWYNSSDVNSTMTPDYEYDLTDTFPIVEELVPVSLVYGLTLLLGIVGNSLVIFSVTRYEQMMTITNTFLLSLATADLLLILVCVPVKVCENFSHIKIICLYNIQRF